MSLIEKAFEDIKKAPESLAIKDAVKKIASSGIETARQLVRKKQEASDEREKEKPRYYRQLNLRRPDGPWLSNSIVTAVNGGVEYYIETVFAYNKRSISIYDRQKQLLVSAKEDRPLFNFWGNIRETAFSVSICGSPCGTATHSLKGLRQMIKLDPQKWHSIETMRKCEVLDPLKEVLAETVGLIRNQGDTPILFYNPSDELLSLMVLLLQTALHPGSFNPSFERYYEKMIISYSSD